MEECGSSQDSSRCSTPMPPPGATTTIIGSPEGNGTLGPVQIVTHEVTPTEIVCSPTVIVQHALAPGSPAANCAANSELSSSWGGPIGGPTIFDLNAPSIMNTDGMLRNLPIIASPVAAHSPGIVSVGSMSPEPEHAAQEELANMLNGLQIVEDGTQNSPGPKRPRHE